LCKNDIKYSTDIKIQVEVIDGKFSLCQVGEIVINFISLFSLDAGVGVIHEIQKIHQSIHRRPTALVAKFEG
jgi:hypothetical protein